MSIEKPEGEPIETCIESAVEIALPFLDDFSQGSGSGDTVELEVRLHLLLLSPFSPSPVVYLPARKTRKTHIGTYVATGVRSRAVGKRTGLHRDRNYQRRRTDG